MTPSDASILANPAPTAAPDVALDVRDVTAAYGQAVALHGVSMQVRAGECAALIGANGAGKTTLLRVVAGTLKPRSGSVTAFGTALTPLSAAATVRAGIAMAPEGRRLFREMSVEENLLLGAFVEPSRARQREALERMYGLFPRVSERRKQIAGTMSGGEQQMVAICRALMSAPRLLLLDEPTLGLSPLMVDHVADMINQIKSTGTTIVLVEQNARVALELSNHATVLEGGRVALAGPSAELENDPQVQRAFLGI